MVEGKHRRILLPSPPLAVKNSALNQRGFNVSSPNKPEVAPARQFHQEYRSKPTSLPASTPSATGPGIPASPPTTRAAPLDAAKLRTRFPPEPNGYLHFGHAKSIPAQFRPRPAIRRPLPPAFSTTPTRRREDQEYVDSIIDAVKWLGCSWEKDGETNLYYASNYFDWMLQCAEALIAAGHAYVDSQSADRNAPSTVAR